MIERQLKEGADRMGIEMDPIAIERFDLYYRLIVEGNKTANLTRITDPREAVDRHFLDSLGLLVHGALLPKGAKVVDVGSGAGLPGLPLKIARPDIVLTLNDSQIKRVRFLTHAVEALGFDCPIQHGRVEDFAKNAPFREGFDLAVARAVAPAPVLMEWLLPLVKVGGRAIAYKGPGGVEEGRQAERAVVELGGRWEAPKTYAVPGRTWERVLLVAQKEISTPSKYPRKPGIARKDAIL